MMKTRQTTTKATTIFSRGILGVLALGIGSTLSQAWSLLDGRLPSTNSLTREQPVLPLERLSSGKLMMLDRGGDLVQWPASIGHRSTDLSIIAGLDPRVGLNLRLGPDPAALPANQRAQAEPHIARDPGNADTLAATFQEGRYTDGGAIDCGYSISHDGGLSWSRALIPSLTQVTGGPYYRATDPVAGFDLQGNIYLNTLGALDSTFNFGAVAISRSTNGGASFGAPVEIFRQTSSSLSPDKNWMAINTFSNTPTAGRIVVTWTMFTLTASPIARSYSDDGGKTWSSVGYATPTSYFCQGSQPLFLPDGTLAMPYWNFSSSLAAGAEAIEIVTSTNGGVSFSSARLVTAVTEYSAPGIRQGTFLPSAATDRTNGALYVAYQTLYQGAPRIMFTKSVNKGTNWSLPKPISDNPTNSPVFNAAISVSPDGQLVTVIFYDERMNPGQTYLLDEFLAQSVDGGNTWQPNLRLTTISSDARLAPLTSSGYMLGDYQGIAPADGPDVPAVPIWIDTRSGNPDPFITRVGVAARVTFRLSGSGATSVITTTHERLRTASDLTYAWVRSANLISWSVAVPSNVVV